MITDPKAKGYRPPGCDRGSGSSICCSHGCSADRELLELASEPARAEDTVVEANRQLLLDRSRVGVKKYGTTLGAAGLSRNALVRHALEEALDLANYLQAILQQDEASK